MMTRRRTTRWSDRTETLQLRAETAGFPEGAGTLGLDSGFQLGVDRGGFPLPGGLAGFFHQFFDRLDRNLHFLVGIQHRTQHLVFGQFLRL